MEFLQGSSNSPSDMCPVDGGFSNHSPVRMNSTELSQRHPLQELPIATAAELRQILNKGTTSLLSKYTMLCLVQHVEGLLYVCSCECRTDTSFTIKNIVADWGWNISQLTIDKLLLEPMPTPLRVAKCSDSTEGECSSVSNDEEFGANVDNRRLVGE